MDAENASLQGRVNLAGGIVLSIVMVMISVPPLIATVINALFDRDPHWDAWMPVACLTILAVYFLASIYMVRPIPEGPPGSTNRD
ncbi:MAG: hypothetical protein ACKVT1_15915 [Dehalococcoidia bacterium]